MKLQMNNENICTVNDLNKPCDRGRKREIYPVVSIASVGYVQWKVESVEVTICRQRERGSLFPFSTCYLLCTAICHFSPPPFALATIIIIIFSLINLGQSSYQATHTPCICDA